MTPFATQLRFLRQDRGLSQNALAQQLGLNSKIVSALETGRRRPPSTELLDRISTVLHLADAEVQQLNDAARYSTYSIKIPRDTSPQNLRLLHQVLSTLSGLRSDQLTEVVRKIEGRHTA